MRVPLADGTLAATPAMPEPDLIPSLLAASDVLGTGWFAATAAAVGTGKTVAVVGDGAVGLLGVMAARQLGAERIIAMSRHEDRQKLALEFGATDIVTERGDEGVERIKELTGGYGAHSVLECVGTPEAMQQAIRSTRRGGHVGYVGVPHDMQLDVVRNYALVDGNKRLGWLAVVVFYGLNDVNLDAPDDQAYDLVIALASGTTDYADAAAKLASWH